MTSEDVCLFLFDTFKEEAVVLLPLCNSTLTLSWTALLHLYWFCLWKYWFFHVCVSTFLPVSYDRGNVRHGYIFPTGMALGDKLSLIPYVIWTHPEKTKTSPYFHFSRFSLQALRAWCSAYIETTFWSINSLKTIEILMFSAKFTLILRVSALVLKNWGLPPCERLREQKVQRYRIMFLSVEVQRAKNLSKVENNLKRFPAMRTTAEQKNRQTL